MNCLHRVRRAAYRTQDVLAVAAMAAPAAAYLTIAKVRHSSSLGEDMSDMFLAAVVTAPVWVPVALLRWLVVTAFQTRGLAAEFERERRARRDQTREGGAT